MKVLVINCGSSSLKYQLIDMDGDYYVFDEEHYELVGERTRKKYKLGQTVKIQVVSVDRYLKTIDFLPVRKFD